MNTFSDYNPLDLPYYVSVTWEGVEHEGIGIYDDAYLSYIKSFVDKAHEYNFKIFIDFHQDVWSRFTGGDGAPRWTLEFAGFQVEHLEDTGAAILYHPENHKPHILWATNASKLATATMFTLFFGGNTFAPKRGIQDLLQQAYFGMMQQVMERLKNHPAILGYDVMNEPLPGYIGCADLRKPFGIMQLDCSPTPYEGMRLGNGEALAVDVWKQRLLSIRPVAKQMLNVHHKRAWQEGVPCPWQEEGVYERPDYFAGYSFEEEFYKPFLKKAKACIRQIDAKTMILIAHVPGAPPPIWDLEEGEGSVVFTSHWYDGFVLATKQFFYIPWV